MPVANHMAGTFVHARNANGEMDHVALYRIVTPTPCPECQSLMCQGDYVTRVRNQYRCRACVPWHAKPSLVEQYPPGVMDTSPPQPDSCPECQEWLHRDGSNQHRQEPCPTLEVELDGAPVALDVGIAPLVLALRELGIKTSSSCEGHPFSLHDKRAYVVCELGGQDVELRVWPDQVDKLAAHLRDRGTFG